jgi:hypothetical protein
MMMYSPGTGGTQLLPKLPHMSVVTSPMSCQLPLGSIDINFTVTPFASVGFDYCTYMYSIHALMSSSDIAGVPAAPGDWSVTEPVIITLVPSGAPISGAVTVVALGPLP